MRLKVILSSPLGSELIDELRVREGEGPGVEGGVLVFEGCDELFVVDLPLVKGKGAVNTKACFGDLVCELESEREDSLLIFGEGDVFVASLSGFSNLAA